VALSPRLLDLLSLLGYHAANSPGLLIRLARVLAYVTDYHMHVLGRQAGSAPRTALARAEHQKVIRVLTPALLCPTTAGSSWVSCFEAKNIVASARSATHAHICSRPAVLARCDVHDVGFQLRGRSKITYVYLVVDQYSLEQ